MINKHQKEYKKTLEKTKVPLGKRPDWLKVKLPTGDNYGDVRRFIKGEET